MAENYIDQINGLIQKMTAEKTFSADIMDHFLGLKKIADKQAETIVELEKGIVERDEYKCKLVEEKSELTESLIQANSRVTRYKKEAKEVRKTKRELKVTLLETKLGAEKEKTAYVRDCLCIMFKNPVYQEAFNKSIN